LRFTSLRRVAVAGLAVALLAAPLLAQDAISIRPNEKVGARYKFANRRVTETKADISSGGQVVQSLEQSETVTLEGTSEVLLVREGEAVKVRVSFQVATQAIAANGLAPMTNPLPVAGGTYVVERLVDGSIVTDYKGANAELANNFLSGYVKGTEAGFLPRNPVRVGETWQVDPAVIQAEFDLGPGDKGEAQLVLKGLQPTPGGQAAAVGLKVSVVQSNVEGFLTVSTTLEGEGLIDTGTGQFHSLTINGPILMNGEQQMPGQPGQPATQISVNGGGSMTAVSTSTPLAGNSIPPGNPIPSSPLPPIAGGDPPVAPPVTPPAPAPEVTPEPPVTPVPGGGWGAPTGPDLSTPEATVAAMFATLSQPSFDAFKAVHSARIQGTLTEADFQSGKDMLKRFGLPPIQGYETVEGGHVKVKLPGGRVLTTLVKEGDSYRADTIWTK
jgi:hypothetical protein